MQFYQLIFFFFLISLQGFAQDVIYLQNYDTLLSKVIFIKQNEVEYKKFNNLDGPSYFLTTEKINKIVYSNGFVDNFNELEPRVHYYGKNAVLFMLGGDKIEIIVGAVDANNVRYKKKDNLLGPDYYSSIDNILKIEYANGDKDIYNELHVQKSVTRQKVTSNVIRVDWNSYHAGDYRISSKKVEKKLEALNDADVTKLLNEARQVKMVIKILNYSSIGFAIIGSVTAFVGLVTRVSNGNNEVLVFSGWTGFASLVSLTGGGSLNPVYKDRMRRAIYIYNQKVE